MKLNGSRLVITRDGPPCAGITSLFFLLFGFHCLSLLPEALARPSDIALWPVPIAGIMVSLSAIKTMFFRRGFTIDGLSGHLVKWWSLGFYRHETPVPFRFFDNIIVASRTRGAGRLYSVLLRGGDDVVTVSEFRDKGEAERLASKMASIMPLSVVIAEGKTQE